MELSNMPLWASEQVVPELSPMCVTCTLVLWSSQLLRACLSMGLAPSPGALRLCLGFVVCKAWWHATSVGLLVCGTGPWLQQPRRRIPKWLLPVPISPKWLLPTFCPVWVPSASSLSNWLRSASDSIQEPFKALALCWGSEPVKICTYPLRVDSLLSLTLWLCST